MTTRSYIGRRLPRLEDQRLLRGEGRFTDDWTLANESFAAFVRSPHAHARILGLHTTAAALAPGVLAVLSGADYQADGGVGIAHLPVPADVVDYQRPAFGSFNGSVPLDEPQPPLATERVRYVGEAVAIVVATSRAAAIDAAGIVEVDYQPLPAVSDVVEAIGDDAPRVGPAGSSSNTCLDAMFGDQPAVEQAIRSADLVVERAFRVQRVANAQLEPRAVVAEYDPDTESYVMVAGSQGVVRQRAALAAVLHLPVDHLRVISPDVGGGFGPRTALYPEQVAVTWAARRVGRPVRWTGDRTEAFLADFQGRDAQARARLALTADGRVLALDADFLFNIGGYTGSYVPLN
ncbi:MAG TPA: molybdopterin cofactor-binding domain-containing protein, partial [Chloroflexota bacterium]